MVGPERGRDFQPSPEEILIGRADLARRAGCGPSSRWHEAQHAAILEARGLLRPRARDRELRSRERSLLFRSETPVADIASSGRCWAFIATIGEDLELKVRDHMARGNYLEGVLLDCAGSLAVEALCDLLESRCPGEEGPTTARFSPGYCGWSLESQSALLGMLKPADLGVELRPSLLMHPLKTVSGLVVHAPPDSLRVPARACRQCDAKGCTRRRAPRDIVEDAQRGAGT